MKLLNAYENWFNQRSNPIRISLLCLMIVFIFFIAKISIIAMIAQYSHTLSSQVTYMQDTLNKLTREGEQYKTLSSLPVDAQLSDQLTALETQLNETVHPLIMKNPVLTPENSQHLLEALANTGQDLHLNQLNHNNKNITLALHGGYLALIQYLQSIDQTPFAFALDELHYQVEEYPNAKITLILHPLTTPIHFFQTVYPTITDPTRPAHWNQQKTKIPEHILLTGSFSYPTDSIAVINGEKYRVGDSVDQYQITQITPSAVYLRNKSGITMVPLVTDVKSNVESGA